MIQELRRDLIRRLAEGGVESAAFEAAELLCHVLGTTRAALPLLPPTAALSEGQRAQLEQLVARRLQGQPLQYLLGEWSFYGRSFLTPPGVLIPRPETELLVERALGHLRGQELPAVLDLCCGGGCIGLTLALECGCEAVLLDLSPSALSLARRNADRLGAICEILSGDMLQPPAPPLAARHFDLIVCNPPYLRSDELAQLQREVAFEPPLALDGGVDGLLFYRALVRHWASLLKPGGLLLVEHGMGQGTEVTGLFIRAGLTQVETNPDYAGIDRMTEGRKGR